MPGGRFAGGLNGGTGGIAAVMSAPSLTGSASCGSTGAAGTVASGGTTSAWRSTGTRVRIGRASPVSQVARAAVATPVRAAVVNASVVTSLTGTLTGAAAAAAAAPSGTC